MTIRKFKAEKVTKKKKPWKLLESVYFDRQILMSQNGTCIQTP